MKTCLYQPIFINPQAYFVFPSLYHIEKGDSFIEPANITGQLIINTLTDDPTLTPIILTVKDNNQVDFSIFAGKHIRISQYTDQGAVVLGEWLIPGESAPVYPDWFTSSVKAIYDPAKQGMTNYDVIEAYTEDFKKWNNSPEKYTGSLTSNSLALTNVSQKTALIYSPIKPYDFKVLIRGLQEGQHVKFGFDYGEHILEADKDGVYTLEWKEGLISYGIYTNFVGECNITITQLPTSILKDLSGNGNHAYLYGGKGKLNSGMGVYQEDFSINTWNKTSFVFDYSHDYIKAKFKTINAGHRNVIVSNSNVSLNSMKIKVIIKGNSKDNRIMYSYADENGAQKVYYINNGETGIVPKSIATKTNDFLVGFRYNENNGDDCEITITQIPDYPDQLCYDGKMYAVCYGFPILTDYTVMADRTWFDNEGNRVFITKGNIWPNCAFNFEKVNASLSSETFSYSQSTNIDDLIGKSGITYQTKQSYNGKIIGLGTSSDGDILLIGGQLKGEYIGCHGKIIIADRSFTQEEIDWIKENIYNIEI